MFHTPHTSLETAGTWLASKCTMEQFNDAHIIFKELIHNYQKSRCLGWFSTVGLPFITPQEMMGFSLRFPSISDRMQKIAAFTSHAIYEDFIYKVSFSIPNKHNIESSALRNEMIKFLKDRIHKPISWTLADSKTWNAIGNNGQDDINITYAYLSGENLMHLHSLLSSYESLETENTEGRTPAFPKHSLRIQGFYS
jgi:hypothetical protein